MSEYLDYILDFIKIISFLFSVIALYISLKVYKLFYFREVRKKQLDLVLKLIKDFQEFEFLISFIHSTKEHSSETYITTGNIFSLSKKKKGKEISILKQNDIIEFPVYLTEEIVNQLNISDYLHNPLLPNEISNKLRNIFSDEITFSNTKTLTEAYFVLINISRILDSKELDELGIKKNSPYVSRLGINYGAFIKNTDELKIELNKWLKKIGIKDLNLKWNK
ncbi:hypothetical protein [Tenacibaculum sp. IB213877]|uniref:hypothetical protein n=1 Tax=Tenacibaculum sp. IB213877 TaxID=3097351 RepID=UPI002A5B0942|nr:hypothetical protein [Tenacibaculum sp. IB213877]MDY0780231.1 hypothetical protein [Tenacibaculum sp. IB213877]